MFAVKNTAKNYYQNWQFETLINFSQTKTTCVDQTKLHAKQRIEQLIPHFQHNINRTQSLSLMFECEIYIRAN